MPVAESGGLCYMLSLLLAVCALCCRHCWHRALCVLVAIAGVVFYVLADCRCVRALLLVALAELLECLRQSRAGAHAECVGRGGLCCISLETLFSC
jgi:hypothetical protein